MKIVEQKVELIDSMGSDLSVVNAARVSFHKESNWETRDGLSDLDYDPATDKWDDKRLAEKDQKLIAYLAKHNHWTPFAHAFLSFRIKAPIFVARQLVKHQVGLAWNEVSRRYVDEEPEFWFPAVWRKRAENVKQGSGKDFYPLDEYNTPAHAVGPALEHYTALVQDGVAPELARIVLPQNTMTEWIWSGSLAAFARVCKLRLDPHAQAETREVAQMIHDQVPKDFEHSWRALLG
jgi:thymidylate synthase (FAD)